MFLSLVSNNDLSHLNGFRFQKTMNGNQVSESIEWNGGKPNDRCFDMHRRDTTVRYVSRFAAEDERATHRQSVVIEDDGRRKQDVAFWDSGCGVGGVHCHISFQYIKSLPTIIVIERLLVDIFKWHLWASEFGTYPISRRVPAEWFGIVKSSSSNCFSNFFCWTKITIGVNCQFEALWDVSKSSWSNQSITSCHNDYTFSCRAQLLVLDYYYTVVFRMLVLLLFCYPNSWSWILHQLSSNKKANNCNYQCENRPVKL